MKRFLFSVCALAAVVVGCSKSEVLNRPNAEVPIEFNPYAGRVPVTRSTSANIDTLGHYGFQVYAFLYNNDGPDWTSSPYMNKVVTCENPSAEVPEWTYSGHAYWPASRKLAFIAYGLNTGDLISRPANGEEYEFDFTVPDAVAEQKDLLVAAVQRDQAYIEETEGAPEDGTVDFTFSHLLSRIGFSLVTKDTNNVPVTIEQVNLTGTFYEKGHVDLTDVASTTIKIDEEQKTAGRPFIDPEEVDAKEKTYVLLPNGSYTHKGSAAGTPIHDNSLLYIKNDLEGTDNDAYVENEFKNAEGTVDTNAKTAAENAVAQNLLNRYMMIIPTVTPVISTGATATTKELTHNAMLKVKYFLPGAGTFDEVTVDLKDIDFEPGKSYDFKFKVSTAGISFSVEVEGWDTTGEDREVIKLN